MEPVNFEEKDFLKCKCPECPVQEESECIKERLNQMTNGEELDGEKTHKEHLPKPGLSPALYCSTQVNGTTCNDLNYERPCMCPTCPVWHKHELGSNYYCQRGNAEKIG